MLNWLTVSLSGNADHQLVTWAAWHARSMVLAWGVVLPSGALIARYLKVTRAQRWPERVDNRAWWQAHLALQYGGVGLMIGGVWVAFGLGQSASAVARAHAMLGWVVVALGLLQMVGGWLRGSKGGPTEAALRGDHYDMTLRRRAFERMHKSFGWGAVVLAVVVIGLGLVAVDAPRWMPLMLGVWWAVLVAWALRMQRAGRCVDTYQALWGPDPKHPGNLRPPIGWGVTRPRAASDAPPGVMKGSR